MPFLFVFGEKKRIIDYIGKLGGSYGRRRIFQSGKRAIYTG